MTYSTGYRGYYITVKAQILKTGVFRAAKVSLYDSKDTDVLYHCAYIHQTSEGLFYLSDQKGREITSEMFKTMAKAIEFGLSYIKEQVDSWVSSKSETEIEFNTACEMLGLVRESYA